MLNVVKYFLIFTGSQCFCFLDSGNMHKDIAGDAPSASTTRVRHRKRNSDVCLLCLILISKYTVYMVLYIELMRHRSRKISIHIVLGLV